MLPLPSGDGTVTVSVVIRCVVFLDLLRPCVVRLQALVERQRRHAADGVLLGAVEKVTARDLAMLVLVEEIQQLLRVVRRFLSFHGSSFRKYEVLRIRMVFP
jgi:hypothetical protein